VAGDYTRLQPVVRPRSVDQARDATEQRQAADAWARWDTACKQVPAARALLAEVDRQLLEVEANLAAAERALEAAHAAYVLRTTGGQLLLTPTGQPTYMTHQDEEDRDPGLVVARAERTKWIQARGQLWRHADQARAVIAHAESQRPPGERPKG
jgi:hypothetical protein